jgi:hypothetical protein
MIFLSFPAPKFRAHLLIPDARLFFFMFVLRSVEQEVNVVLGPAGMTKAVSDFAAVNKAPA